MYKILSVSLFFLLTIGQIMAQPIIDYGQITTGYYRIDRTQIGGSASLNLNKNFDYIHFFNKQRFDPTKSSSFSYINYVIKDYNHSIDFFIGAFRNHTKGDFILSDTEVVHFGHGNSHFGLGLGFDLSLPKIKEFAISVSLFSGVGPQISQWTSENHTVSPKKIGVRGIGSVAVGSVNITTPVFLKFFSLGLGYRTTFHYANFFDFSIKDMDTGELTNFTDLDLMTIGMSPMVQLNFNIIKRQKMSKSDDEDDNDDGTMEGEN